MKSRMKRKTRAFTVLEVLVTLFVVALLLAVMLPAVMHARELARRIQCTNNLRQLGIALHQYHDHVRSFPRAWGLDSGKPRFASSWASQLLPQIEAQNLREPDLQTNSSGLFDSYEDAAKWQLSIFTCPSDIEEPAFELSYETTGHDSLAGASFSKDPTSPPAVRNGYLPTANYVSVYGTVEADEFEELELGNRIVFGDGSIIDDRGIRFHELLRGASQTLLVGERKMAMVPSTWFGVDLDGEDAACRLTGSAITRPNCEPCDECEFSSRHSGGSLFLWADGHVTLVPDSVDTTLYRQSAKREM